MLKKGALTKKIPIVIAALLAVISISSLIIGAVQSTSHPDPGDSAYISLEHEDTPARIEINCTLPDVPTTVKIMQVKGDLITKDKATSIASRLFDEIDTFEDKTYGWRGISGYREVIVFKYGGFMNYDHEEFMHHGAPAEEYPPPEECRRIADQYLTKIMDDETVPTGITVYYQDTVSDIHQTIHRNGTIVKETWTNIHVNYVQKVNGYELYGPGAKIRVYLDKDGVVIGFVGRFWDLEPVRNVAVISPGEAIGKLEAGGDVAYINSVKLVYYVEFGGRQVLYPYYHITGVLTSCKHGSMEFTRTLSATS